MNSFTIEQRTGEIVKIFPKASDIFRQYKIDFCCSGDRPLIEAITDNSLNGELVLEKLNNAYQQWLKEDNESTNWDRVSISELIDHIQNRYHAGLVDELLGIYALILRVFRVHGHNHPPLEQLFHTYNLLQKELLEHTIKEDRDIFPMMIEYELHPTDQLLEKIREANGNLEDEHSVTGRLLQQLREITEDFTPPVWACATFQLTYARLAELEEETFQHIHLENNILFKKL